VRSRRSEWGASGSRFLYSRLVLLTVGMILRHITNGDGKAAILWAIAPTLWVFAVSVLPKFGFQTNEWMLPFAISGGLFVLTGVFFLDALRKFRGR